MIKMVFCVKRRPDVPEAEFYEYWLNQHGPLVRSRAEALNVRRYVQSHTVVNALDAAVSAARGMQQQPFDGLAELWWDDIESMQAATGSDAGQAANAVLLEDEQKFIDLEGSTIFFTEEHEVVSPG